MENQNNRCDTYSINSDHSEESFKLENNIIILENEKKSDNHTDSSDKKTSPDKTPSPDNTVSPDNLASPAGSDTSSFFKKDVNETIYSLTEKYNEISTKCHNLDEYDNDINFIIMVFGNLITTINISLILASIKIDRG